MELSDKLSVIVELTKLLRKENRILDIYEEITKIATDITHSERCSLFIYDKDKNLLTSKIAQGLDEKISITLDEGIAGYCGKTRRCIIENDVYSNPLFNVKIDLQSGYTTGKILAVPIVGRFDNLLGVLQVLNKKGSDYSENDGDLLQIVAELASSVIEDHRIKGILKEQIDVKTGELKEANEKLAQRVDYEVALNRKLQEEKTLQNELLIERSKLAELGKMIGFISHQMKQPLNAMYVVSQGLRDTCLNEVKREESLAEIEGLFFRNIKFLSQTIDDFRLFVKHERKIERFEAGATIEGTLRLLQPILYLESITIEKHFFDRCFVTGICNEFKQVIINLVMNAVDQLKLKETAVPKVVITVKEIEGGTRISVMDNGGGIDPALAPERIFDADVTTKGREGTGLGLSMSRLIVEAHMNGTILAQNREGGAEFVMVLP